jgi:hypothetical protein
MGVELVLFLCAGSSVRLSLQLQDHPHATTREEQMISLSMSYDQVEWVYDQLFRLIQPQANRHLTDRLIVAGLGSEVSAPLFIGLVRYRDCYGARSRRRLSRPPRATTTGDRCGRPLPATVSDHDMPFGRRHHAGTHLQLERNASRAVRAPQNNGDRYGRQDTYGS